MSLNPEHIDKNKKQFLYVFSVTWGVWFLSLLFIFQFKDAMTETLYAVIQWTGIGFMFISLWFGYRLFRINRLEVNNPGMSDRLNDEREQMTRLKSLANGFVATIIIYTAYLCLSIILKVMFGNLSLYALSGTFTGGVTLIMAYFVAVFTYFKHNNA